VPLPKIGSRFVKKGCERIPEGNRLSMDKASNRYESLTQECRLRSTEFLRFGRPEFSLFEMTFVPLNVWQLL
jgi:hypothetical protein